MNSLISVVLETGVIEVIFVNVVDFLETVNYNEIKKDAKNGDTDAFMTLIELTYNFWNLAYRDIMDKDSQKRME